MKVNIFITNNFFVSLLVFFLLIVHAAPTLALSMNVTVEKNREVISLSLPQPATKIFTLDKPDRVVVDIPALPKNIEVKLPPEYQGKILRRIRSGRFDPTTTRIVFDLLFPPGSLKTESKIVGGLSEVTITMEYTAEPGVASSADVPDEVAQPSLAPVKKPEKPMVIIDAGHGGRDPGTIGKHKTREKEIVLDYAKSLKKALEATGRYRVKLTRDDDRFILLRERVAIGRKEEGDLFISLHADSAPGADVNGLSLYTLSETASDKEAAALAAQENKVDIVYGLDLSDQSKDVADILISLAQRDTNNRSVTLASSLVASLRKHNVNLLTNAHRFAGFAVLKAPDIPSVLIELGFLSNDKEEKLLQSSSHRSNIIGALVDGVDRFFKEREKIGT